MSYKIPNPYFNTPDIKLTYFFTPTKENSSESRKANIKNHNLPILQKWCNGDPYEPLKCSILNEIGFYVFPDFITGVSKIRFGLDYNHYRQRQDGKCHSGVSIDKGLYNPSAVIRGFRLDEPENLHYLLEIMTTIPLSQLMHSFVSQDSAKGNVTLENFKKEWWPWGLKNRENFNEFTTQYGIKDIDYDKFINMLCDINAPSVQVCYANGLLK